MTRPGLVLPGRRATVDRALAFSPLQPASRFVARGHLEVLTYHRVDDGRAFERHLDYIVRRMNPVSLEHVIDAIQRGTRLPNHAVLVTFDDGHRTVLDVAAPMLHERGIQGVAFVVGGVIGTDQPFWWDEAATLVAAGGRLSEGLERDPSHIIARFKGIPDNERLAGLAKLRATARGGRAKAKQLSGPDLLELERMGVEVANHTMTHPCLPRCSRAKIENEIRQAHFRLEALLGHEPRSFAYPNGDWDRRAEAVLADLGYQSAFLFDHRTVRPRTAHPLRMSRLRIDAGASLHRFRIVTSGLHPFIHRLRGIG